MHLSFSAVNEDADENSIPFSAKNESHLCLSPNLVTVSVANTTFSAQRI